MSFKQSAVPDATLVPPLSDGGGARLFLAAHSLVGKQDWQDMLRGGKAARRAQQLAQKGNPRAMVAWGQMLLGGHGVARDMPAAFSWFERAGAKDFAPAITLCGRCYEHGWGVWPDQKLAFLCYRRAADLGDMWGLFNLADCYRKGVATVADDKRAHMLYFQAAQKGHVKALNMLGLIYEEGRGVTCDEGKAAEYFAQGAKGGDCWACFNHARFLAARGACDEAHAVLEQSLRCHVGDYCQTVADIFAHSQDEWLRDFARRAGMMARMENRQGQDREGGEDVRDDHPA